MRNKEEKVNFSFLFQTGWIEKKRDEI